MKEACIVALLGINSVLDLRKKQVSLVIVGVFAAAGLLWALKDGRMWGIFAGVGVGAFFLGLSLLTRGAVGMGDSWIVLAMGMFLEPMELLAVLFAGLFCSAVWAAVMLAVFRKGRNTEIPFVPFLLLGYIGELLLW